MSFLDIPVSHGRLEALLQTPEKPRAAALVCHPHPSHGGTMHNHVTYWIAQAFRKQNLAVLRFNFRGVGRSTGSYDEGRGELTDARDALNFLAEKLPALPLYVSGFSFGARVALRLGLDDPRPRGALAVGLAVDLFDFSFVTELRIPKTVVQADRDEYASLANVEELWQRVPEPKKLFILPNSDHLATGRLQALEEVLVPGVEWLLNQA